MAFHIIFWIIVALIVLPLAGKLFRALGLFALLSRNNTRDRRGY